MPPRRRNAKTSTSAPRSRKQPPSDTSIVEAAPEQKEMEVEVSTSTAEEPATRVPEGVVEEEKREEVVGEQEQEQEAQESNEAPSQATLEERTEKLKLLRQRMVYTSIYSNCLMPDFEKMIIIATICTSEPC